MKNAESSLKAAKAAAAVKEKRIIKFLNNVKKPEELAEMLETAGNRAASMRAARKLLNYRNGKGLFKSLKDVAGVPQLGKETFTRLVTRLSDIETTFVPTTTAPTFRVDGQVRDGLAAGVIEFSMVERETHGPRCEAAFLNWDAASSTPGFLWSDRSVLDFGKTLGIQARAGVMPIDIFKGCITGMKADYPADITPRVTITAENRYEAQMKITRRTRTFENVSDADIIQRIANEHGMQVDTDDEGAWHQVLVAAGRSDMEFIRERARAMGAGVAVDGDTLRIRSLRHAAGPAMSFTYGRQLTAFSVQAELDGQLTGVTAFAWSPSDKSIVSFQTSGTGVWEQGQTGSAILGEVLTGADDEIVQPGATGEELRVLAETRYREAVQRFVRGRGVVAGYAGVRVGSMVALYGLGAMFSGNYFVTEVKLTYTKGSGYSTQFDVERPGINPA